MSRTRAGLGGLVVSTSVLAAGLTGCAATAELDALPATPARQVIAPRGAAPAPVARLAESPPRGMVQRASGPFDDRYALTSLRLVSTSIPTLTGRIRVVSDVSHLIDLELRVAFYDASGALLGVRQQTWSEEDNAGEHGTAAEQGGLAVRVVGPVGAVAAVVDVPMLVNE